jgi:hypothetical protein
MMRARFFFLGSILLLGCAQSKYAPVAGTITMDGKPLANVVVNFQPSGSDLNPGPGSTGRTNANGEYSLRLIGGGAGAVLGWHRVEVNPVVESSPDDDRAPAAKVKIPTKYNRKTELQFEVKRGDNKADFQLSSK